MKISAPPSVQMWSASRPAVRTSTSVASDPEFDEESNDSMMVNE